MRRWRGVNETSELDQWNGVINASVWSKNKDRTMRSKSVMACVSDLLCDGGHASDNNLRSLTVRHLVGDDVDTTVTGHTDLGRKVAEINTDDGLDTMSAGGCSLLLCDEIPDRQLFPRRGAGVMCVYIFFRHCSAGAGGGRCRVCRVWGDTYSHIEVLFRGGGRGRGLRDGVEDGGISNGVVVEGEWTGDSDGLKSLNAPNVRAPSTNFQPSACRAHPPGRKWGAWLALGWRAPEAPPPRIRKKNAPVRAKIQ